MGPESHRGDPVWTEDSMLKTCAVAHIPHSQFAIEASRDQEVGELVVETQGPRCSCVSLQHCHGLACGDGINTDGMVAMRGRKERPVCTRRDCTNIAKLSQAPQPDSSSKREEHTPTRVPRCTNTQRCRDAVVGNSDAGPG